MSIARYNVSSVSEVYEDAQVTKDLALKTLL